AEATSTSRARAFLPGGPRRTELDVSTNRVQRSGTSLSYSLVIRRSRRARTFPAMGLGGAAGGELRAGSRTLAVPRPRGRWVPGARRRLMPGGGSRLWRFDVAVLPSASTSDGSTRKVASERTKVTW